MPVDYMSVLDASTRNWESGSATFTLRSLRLLFNELVHIMITIKKHSAVAENVTFLQMQIIILQSFRQCVTSRVFWVSLTYNNGDEEEEEKQARR